MLRPSVSSKTRKLVRQHIWVLDPSLLYRDVNRNISHGDYDKSRRPCLLYVSLAKSLSIIQLKNQIECQIFRGMYHLSIRDAQEYYKSFSGYDDELIWGAAWLYKATRNRKYLNKASQHYSRIQGKYVVETRYSWDRKLCGAQVRCTVILFYSVHTKCDVSLDRTWHQLIFVTYVEVIIVYLLHSAVTTLLQI